MTRKLLFACCACVIILSLVGCSETVKVSSIDYLKPIDKDYKTPEIANPEEVIIPFLKNQTWADELSKFVPVYENPEFMSEKDMGKPEIYRNPLNSNATDITAQTFHKGDPRVIFEWYDKNYSKYGFKLKSQSNDKDSRVYIIVDEHGYFILTDGNNTFEIHVWKLDGYPEWTKVTYSGTVAKDCQCGTR